MMQDMSVGDVVFFYHSGGTKEMPAGIYGLLPFANLLTPMKHNLTNATTITTQGNESIWYCVDIKFAKNLKTL